MIHNTHSPATDATAGWLTRFATWWGVPAALVVVLSLGAGPALADDASLDDLLGLDEEEEEAATEAEDEQAQPGDAPTPPAPQQPDGEIQLDVDLDDLALPTEVDGDVFELAIADMRNAAQRLTDDSDLSIETQRVQQRVLNRLDQLIQMQNQQPDDSDSDGSPQDADTGSDQNEAQQQQAQADEGAGADGADDERATRGQAEHDDLGGDLEERLSEWGNLPPRLRDQVLQGMDDEFSQLYRRLTERYYQRLAEQQQ